MMISVIDETCSYNMLITFINTICVILLIIVIVIGSRVDMII